MSARKGRKRRTRKTPPPERDWTRPRFLFVGLDWQRKGGPAVLRAFRRYREETKDARLDIVGQHPPIHCEGVTTHGPLRLEVQVERDEVERLFEEATCFVMPSRWDPFPIAYLEAAAAGIPIIGGSMGGASHALAGCGVFVPSDDEIALLDAMRALADPTAAARAGKTAQERAKTYTWPAVARRVLATLGY